MEQVFKILDFIIDECNKTTKFFDKSERNNIMFFCLSLLDRLNFSSYGLKILLDEFFKNTKVEYSCGIIIRSVLLDYMILLNGVEILLKENDTIKKQKNLNEYCSTMLSDSTRHTINNISVLYGHISKRELDKMYSNIININPDFFETYNHDGSKPIIKSEFKKAPNANDLYKVIADSDYFSQDAGVYEAYLYYSKYDHFGQIFYEQSRKELLFRLDKMKKAIAFFPFAFHYSIFILKHLYNSNTFLENQSNEIVSFIDDLHKN